MIRAYTITSGKGGTGKTTVTANLGVALAQYGRETCVVDTDIGLANLGLVLGLSETPVTLNEVLTGEAPVQDAIYEGPYGLMVVPGGLSLQRFQDVDPERLKDVVCDLTDICDFLLLDAPAGIGPDAVVALTAADEVLLVVNPEIASIVDRDHWRHARWGHPQPGGTGEERQKLAKDRESARRLDHRQHP